MRGDREAQRARPAWPWLLALAAAAAAVRFIGISWGLPAAYNADEPHLVNLAVSFGGGSLRPAFFKYPSLFPYLLFLCYGIYFALWSGLGLRRGVTDFIGLYAWRPTGFYLIGRALCAACGLLGLAVLVRAQRERRPAGFPWAALTLAFAPAIVENAHAAKPDGLMMLCVCVAWLFILRLYRDGGRREHWAAGLALGLAMSSQYTAVFVPLAALAAHFLSPARPPRRYLWEGALAVALGFFAGSPYILLDFGRFWASMKDLSELAALAPWSRWEVTRRVLANIWGFAGPWSLAGLALPLGLLRLWRGDRRLALVFLAPALGYVVGLGNNPDGGWPRYLMGAFPGLALLSAEGLSWLEELGGSRIATGLLVAAVAGSGLYGSALYDRELLLPDTRQQATVWMRAHVPEGTTLLMDLPHSGPDLRMTRAEIEELRDKTSQAGSPRTRLYRGMAQTHPGGGWKIFRIGRSARDLRSSPRHVQLSQADAPTLDVSAGLAPALAAGVSIVVVSSFGASPEHSPQLAAFFADLDRQATLLREFDPEPGRVMGPTLKVYRVAR
jgi:hypothetical protein